MKPDLMSGHPESATSYNSLLNCVVNKKVSGFNKDRRWKSKVKSKSKSKPWPRSSTKEQWFRENIERLINKLLLISGNIERNPGPEPEPETDDDRSTDHGRRNQKQDGSAQVKTLTYNVRGLNDQSKMRHLINILNKDYLNKEYDAVIALQETNIVKEGLIPYIWRGNFVLTAGAGNARGCLTLLSSHLNVIERSEIEDRGHIVVCQRSDSQLVNYVIANVYGPNKHDNEKITFFENVLDKITEMEIKYNCHNVIILGDLNITFSEKEMKNRLYSMTEKRKANVIKSLFRDANVTDIWARDPKFTWRRPNTDTFSTLDRILYRSELLKPIGNGEVDWSFGFSDHAAVKLNFKTPQEQVRPRGNRLPRLDPSLLNDERTKARLQEEFRSLLEMALDTWDPHTKLEYAKMCLRTVAEKNQADRKKTEATIESEINEALNRAINELASEADPEDRIAIIERIENLRNKKCGLIEEKGARLAARLATKWYNEGEKSTKYFYRILNRTMPDKLSKLEKDNGDEIEGEEEVNKEVVDFYKKLYETTEDVVIEDSFLNNINPVAGETADEVMKRITVEELYTTLKDCNDSSPGPDGISYSFLKTLWDVFGQLLVNSWNYSLDTGNLPTSHKTSILRLIPKAGKNLKKTN